MKVVIFDLDGVLADTHKMLGVINRAFYEKYGIRYEAVVKELHGLPFLEKVKRINKKYGKNISPEDVISGTRHRLLEVCVEAKPRPGAVELVQSLKGKRISMAIATAGIRTYCDKVLRAIGLNDTFNLVITNDDVQQPKPNPEVYLKIAAHFHVNPEDCVVIDDSPNCLRSARSIGMKTIGVICGLTTREELSQLADKVVEHLSELKAEDF